MRRMCNKFRDISLTNRVYFSLTYFEVLAIVVPCVSIPKFQVSSVVKCSQTWFRHMNVGKFIQSPSDSHTQEFLQAVTACLLKLYICSMFQVDEFSKFLSSHCFLRQIILAVMP